MDEDQIQKFTLVGVAALVLGALGPWASAFGISKAGVEGDGVITLIGALVILALLLRFKKPTAALVIAVVVGLILIYDFIDVMSADIVSVGWGLYLSVVGAALVGYTSFQARQTPAGSTGAETDAD